MNKTIVIRNFLWLVLATQLTFLGQGCTSGGNPPVAFSNSSSSDQATGGDGQPFDNKPDPGTYVREIPGLVCGGQEKTHSELEVTAGAAKLRTLQPSNCQTTETPVALGTLSGSRLNHELLGFSDGVYVKKSPTQPVVESLCRLQTAARALELVVTFDPGSRRLSASASGSFFAGGSWTDQPKQILNVGRDARVNGVRYFTPGFDLQIDPAMPSSSVRTGRLTYTYGGQTFRQAAIECRLGSLFDDKAPRVPSYAFDLAGGILPPTLSYSRSGPGTYFANGLVQVAPPNTARFDSEPISNRPLGILTEQASTNTALDSQDFMTANYRSLPAIVVAGGGSLVGLPRFRIEQAGNLEPFNRVGQNQTLVPGRTYTVSYFAQPGNVNGAFIMIWQEPGVEAQVDFDLSNGSYTILTQAGVTVSGVHVVAVPAGYRIGVTFVPSAAQLDVGLGAKTVTLGEYVYATGLQVEEGSSMTSYIPTTSAPVTRGEDVLRASNLSWLNPAQGTFELDVSRASYANATRAEALRLSGAGSDAYAVGFTPSLFRADLNSGASTATVSQTTSQITNFDLQKVFLSYSASAPSLFVNSSLSVAGSSVSPLVPTAFELGGSSGAKWNGHIKSMIYWPNRVPDSEISLIATP